MKRPHPRRRATSSEVARLAGVSRSTVSFVLNQTPGIAIGQETRERVLAAAAELEYVPNALARGLVSGEAKTIGLVVSRAAHLRVDAFIPQMLYSLAKYSHAYGYRVLLETTDDASQPEAYLKLIRSRQIDGLIALNMRSDDRRVLSLLERSFPLVLLGSTPKGQAEVDGVVSARKATRHLLQLGHRRVAHVAFAPEAYLATQDRLRGYRLALEEAGVPYDQALVRYADFSAESGYLAMQPLIAERPTALFAGNDTVALGAMAAILERGLRIPDDIAVVGYDDIPTAAYFAPPLTTIRTDPVEQAKLAVELLIRRIQGAPSDPPELPADLPLIVRDSCGAKARKAGAPRPDPSG